MVGGLELANGERVQPDLREGSPVGISWWFLLLLFGALIGLVLLVLRKMRTMQYEIEMLERRLNMKSSKWTDRWIGRTDNCH